MTREEAIQWLKVINTKEFGWDEFALQESQRGIRERCEQGVREAIDMAIEALSQPIVCKDYCIDDDHIYCSPKVADRVVEALTRPNGEWTAEEEYGDLWVCDQCGFADDYCSHGERREP